MSLLICLTESGTNGTVRFKIFGENLQTFNYIVPGGPVAEQEHWKLFARGARDHFLIITDGLCSFSANDSILHAFGFSYTYTF